MNITDACELFKVEYPDAAIKTFKFATSRPEHVLLLNHISQNICICQKHENIGLMLQALHNLDKMFHCIHILFFIISFSGNQVCLEKYK